MINYRPPYENELWHHGVAGQKWGVRHGPPYPLYEGHGKSKAVLESKAKYGPSSNNVFRDIVKKKGILKSSGFEYKMARNADDANERYNRLSQKANSLKDGKRKDRVTRRADNAKEIADYYGNLGKKYSSLDVSEQKKISRGYAVTKEIMYQVKRRTASQAYKDAGGAKGWDNDQWLRFQRMHARHQSRDYAESKAIQQIEQAYEDKKKK